MGIQHPTWPVSLLGDVQVELVFREEDARLRAVGIILASVALRTVTALLPVESLVLL